MRFIILFSFILVACNNTEEKTKTEQNDSVKIDTPVKTEPEKEKPAEKPEPKTYSNARFRNVTIDRIAEDSFRVSGQAQIFEASFNWVIEDGHDELKNGYEMTSAGAPEWGNFSFAFKAQKKRANSTLTLILFESSPKDGSRQHELPISLY